MSQTWAEIIEMAKTAPAQGRTPEGQYVFMVTNGYEVKQDRNLNTYIRFTVRIVNAGPLTGRECHWNLYTTVPEDKPWMAKYLLQNLEILGIDIAEMAGNEMNAEQIAQAAENKRFLGTLVHDGNYNNIKKIEAER